VPSSLVEIRAAEQPHTAWDDGARLVPGSSHWMVNVYASIHDAMSASQGHSLL
jgi:hypothetical protein